MALSVWRTVAPWIVGFAAIVAPAQAASHRSVDVEYINDRDGATLAGTLTIPAGESQVPAVLLLSGAGLQDRDETVHGHKPFKVLAEHLAGKGIAVLRTDDRGVGGSRGPLAGATPETFASDALAGISYLRSRPDLRLSAVGFIGHSEGAHVATIAAGSSTQVDFVVMLAGSGLPWAENNQLAQAEMLKRLGKSDAVIAAALDLNQRVYDVVLEGRDAQTTEDLLHVAIASWRASLRGEAKTEFDEFTRDNPRHWDWLADQFAEPPYRYHLSIDPRRFIAKVTCPVLALCGELDVQVIPGPNLAAIDEVLAGRVQGDHEVRELPGLNHLFQNCETGLMSEYAALDEAFSVEAMDVIAEWILERFEAP
jgi:pimeloyl-ACP methyl ester carboxylesterase